MKRIFMWFLSAGFPWIVLLIADDPIGALIALVMQVSIIGWIPASIWAWKAYKKSLINSTEAFFRSMVS